MASARLHFDVGPERVFSVLSDPRSFGAWHVGSHEVHEADTEWPAAGATLRRSQGRWPVVLPDTTTVMACERDRRLELEVRVRPLLVSRVVLSLDPEASGTLVRMDERPTGGLLRLPLLAWPSEELLSARNMASLRRLRWLAEVGARTARPHA